MFDTEKLLIGLCLITVIVITSCTMNYWKHQNELIVRMIENGVDPVAVKCALEDDRGDHPVCLVLATITR